MLEWSPENQSQDGKIVLKLTENVTVDVIDIFLTFIYSGKLKDTRENETSLEPIWVESLPELIDLAHKVSGLL